MGFNSSDKKQGSSLANEDVDYYENGTPTTSTNQNDSSDDEDAGNDVDMTFSQFYEIMKQEISKGTIENIPQNILQTMSKKDLVLSELKKEGMNPQFKRDAEYWYNTLSVFTKQSNQDIIQSDFSLASNITEKFELIALEKKRIDILRRIFVVLRYGDLLWRKSKKTNDWVLWNDLKGLPIATAMSHGSRIIIQLPRSTLVDKKKGIFSKLKNTLRPKDESNHDHGFWTWLLTGDENGSLDMICTPELTNGSVGITMFQIILILYIRKLQRRALLSLRERLQLIVWDIIMMKSRMRHQLLQQHQQPPVERRRK